MNAPRSDFLFVCIRDLNRCLGVQEETNASISAGESKNGSFIGSSATHSDFFLFFLEVPDELRIKMMVSSESHF